MSFFGARVILAEKMETPTGRKVLAKQFRQSHPKEYRAAI
jgi:hypothetical protein